MVLSCCLRSCGPIGSKFVIESGYYACCPLLVLRRVQLHILQSPFHSPNDRQDAAKQLVVLVGVLGGAFRFLILPAVLAKRLLRIGRGDSCRSVTVDSPSLKSPPHRCCLPISWPNSAPPIFAKGPPLGGGGARARALACSALARQDSVRGRTLGTGSQEEFLALEAAVRGGALVGVSTLGGLVAWGAGHRAQDRRSVGHVRGSTLVQ